MATQRNLWDRFTQAVAAGYQTLLRRVGLDHVQAVMVDLSKEEMSRIGPSTGDVKGIYFSDFVESENPNQIRSAREFRKTADTLVTDRKIPLSRISRFYGVEDGKVNVGSLGNFRDSTVVVPVRNRNYGMVSRVDIKEDSSSFFDRITRTTPWPWESRRQRRIYKRELDKLSSLYSEKYGIGKNFVLDGLKGYGDKLDEQFREYDEIVRNGSLSYAEREKYYSLIDDNVQKRNELAQDISSYKKALTDYSSYIKKPKIFFLPKFSVQPKVNSVSFYDGDGKLITDEMMTRASDGKILLADSTGIAIFLNDLEHFPKSDLRSLNRFLEEHPLYPVLVDNGRYSHYQLEAGSYREYIRQDLCRPDESLYVVGSREGRSNGKKLETGEKRDLRREKSAKLYKDLKQADVCKVQHGLKVK